MDRTILLLDDEPQILRALQRLLQRQFNVLATTDSNQALQWLQEHPVGVILCDFWMPKLTGAEFLSQARGIKQGPQRLMLSGHADFNAVTAAINSGACHKFLVKPWDNDELIGHINSAFETFESEHAQFDLPANMDHMLLDAADFAATFFANKLSILYKPGLATEVSTYDIAIARQIESTSVMQPQVLDTDSLDESMVSQIYSWAVEQAKLELQLMNIDITLGHLVVDNTLYSVEPQNWLSITQLGELLSEKAAGKEV